MKLLNTLYGIYSPSHGERKMSAFVQKFLRHHRIDFETDLHAQVFKIIPGRPILSCHMDQVQKGPPGKIIVENGIVRGEKDGLGADDKNGIWVCLQLLLRWDCGFIFSTGEESISKQIEHVLTTSDPLLSHIPYALVFDRRGNGDIIGNDNGYCTKDFETRVAREGLRFGYRPCSGIFSDADSLCQFMECVNLSVGYYHPHTEKEYTVYQELLNALKFGNHLLDSL